MNMFCVYNSREVDRRARSLALVLIVIKHLL